MANLKQVVDVLETLYPLRYAEEWDHPGLIVGDLAAPVRRIVFAADPTMSITEQALERGADLLVTHHPLLFRSVHEVSGLGPHGDIVRRLAQAGCALWVGHTNADASHRGVGQAAADGFGLTDQRPLVPIDDSAATHPVGLGRVGRLPEPMSLRDFAQRVYEALPMRTAAGIQVAGDADMLVETVAVLPGSGDSLFDAACAAGADVYVTSDLRHHPATDHMEQMRHEARLRAAGIALGHAPLAASAATDGHPRPALINTPHSAIESMWFNYALGDVPQAVRESTGDWPEAVWLGDVTDPWDFAISPAGVSEPGPGFVSEAAYAVIEGAADDSGQEA